MSLKPPIIIAGHPKSGTSIIYQALASAKGAAPAELEHGSSGESKTLPLLFQARERLRHVPPAFDAVLRFGLESWLYRVDDRAVEKTPQNIFWLPQIREFLPGASIVVVERDPLAVINSMRSTNWGDLGSGLRKARDWRSIADAWLLARQQSRTVEAAIIRHEWLALKPLEILPELCTWLGIELRVPLTAPIVAGSATEINGVAHSGVLMDNELEQARAYLEARLPGCTGGSSVPLQFFPPRAPDELAS